MRVFVATLDEGSLAGASRRLGRSPAAVSRAIAYLEGHIGTDLLYRSTRMVRLSEAGERYAAACRRVLADLEEADLMATGSQTAARGTLTLTAPVAMGEDVLQPLLDEFLDMYPEVSVKLQLLDRPCDLLDEGFDLGLRLAHLPDSSLVALPIGEVRRVVVASPRYLVQHGPIGQPSDLGSHQIVAMTHFGMDSWNFPSAPGSTVPRTVQFSARYVVNSVRAAVASAVQGRGVARLFSYHVADAVSEGSLEIVLAEHEPSPLPVHLVAPAGRLAVPKLRAFVDFARPRLKDWFEQRALACAAPRPQRFG